ncbi:MAG: hypothetical protein WBC96_03280 [Thermodesulfobacteriota bacterium]
MKRICLDCNQFGEPKISVLNTKFLISPQILLYAVLLEDVVVIFIVATGFIYGFNQNDSVRGIAIFIGGIITFYMYKNSMKTCPNCNSSSLTSIKSPEAQKLIKEQNLSVPKS